MNIDKKKSFLITSGFYIFIVAALYFTLKLLSGPLFPFVVAVVVTMMLQSSIKKWAKRFRIKRKAVSVAAVLLVYIALGFLVVFLGYALYKQLITFLSILPEYVGNFSDVVNNLIEKAQRLFGHLPDGFTNIFEEVPSTAVQTFAETVTNLITQLAGSIAKGIPGFLISLAVTVVASAYFAKDYDDMVGWMTQNVPIKYLKKLSSAKVRVFKGLGSMLKGYGLIMVITFVEVFLGLSIIGNEYALIIAVVTALVDILPVLGSGTVLLPWAVFSILTGDYKKAIGLVVIHLVITAVRNIAEPKIIGDKVGVHPLLMLAAVFLGLKIFGVAGIILLPVTVVIIKSLIPENIGQN